MNLDGARKWLERQASDERLANLWEPLFRDRWCDNRREVMKELRQITPAMIARWDTTPPRLSASNREWLCEQLGCADADLADVGRAAPRLTKNQRELLDKLYTQHKEKGLDYVRLFELAKTDEVAAAHLQKNPTKQGFYEPLSAAFIELRSGVGVLRFEEHNVSLFFTESGEVVFIDGTDAQSDNAHEALTSKTVDTALFFWDEAVLRVILTSHKSARIDGGHQGNQKKDVRLHLEYGLKARGRNPDIPGLRGLLGKELGREIAEEELRWDVAAVLDGEYFADPSSLCSDWPDAFFIGSTDDCVTKLLAVRVAA